MAPTDLQVQQQDLIRTFFDTLSTTIQENPLLLVAIVVPIVTAVAIPIFLELLGFTAAGVVAGSIAAVWQSTIGNVPKGHIFGLINSVTASSKIVKIGGQAGLAVAAFLVIDYLNKNTELQTFMNEELGKCLHGIESTAADVGGSFHDWISSPEVQSFIKDAGKAGKEAIDQIGKEVNNIANSAEVKSVLKGIKDAGAGTLSSFLGLFGW